MLQAIEDDEQALSPLNSGSSRDKDNIVSPLSVKGSSLKESVSELESSGTSTPRSRNPSQGQIPHPSSPPKPRKTSFSSESVLSAAASDTSAFGRASPVSPLSNNDSNSPQALLGRMNSARRRNEQHIDVVLDGRSMEKVFWEDSSDTQEKQSLGKGSDSSVTEFGQSNVTEAVNSAMQQLHQVRLQEQAARPLRYEPQSRTHKPSPETTRAFQSSVNEELQIRRLITRDWIRVATWWLLKARATLANTNKHSFVNSRGSMGGNSGFESRYLANQAYVDLLKASYILYDIVLRDENSPALLTDENRKSISDLSEVSYYTIHSQAHKH